MDLERPWAKTGPQTCPAPSLPQGAPDSFSFVAFGVWVLGNGCVFSHQTLTRSSSSVPESGHAVWTCVLT